MSGQPATPGSSKKKNQYSKNTNSVDSDWSHKTFQSLTKQDVLLEAAFIRIRPVCEGLVLNGLFSNQLPGSEPDPAGQGSPARPG